VSAPFTAPSPFADPSQVFGGDPQAGPSDPSQQDPSQQPDPGAQPQEPDPIDLEGGIAHTIEAACQVATAALETNAEDFMRLSQGIESLANAMKALQPAPNPSEPASIQADQRMGAAMLQHQAQMAKIEADASRPTPSQPSPRG
jgi:hypothetical protein